MKILVCITHVPDTTAKISFIEDNTKFNSDGVQYIIGPYDDYALARAVELRDGAGGTITVLNVGTIASDPTIRKALAIGADNAVRINKEPTDALNVAKEIANYATGKEYDLILMGRESIDGNGGLVHGMVGELLNIPSVSPIMKLEIDNGVATMEKEIEGGKQIIELQLPFVAGCQEPIAEWKIPNMRGIMSARSKPLEVVEPAIEEVSGEIVSYELPAEKGDCKMFDADDVEGLVNALKNDAKVL